MKSAKLCGTIFLLLLIWGVFVPDTTIRAETSVPQSRQVLSETWRFYASPVPIEAEATDFDDSSWDTVTVPHTWSGPNDSPKYAYAWYRTHFTAQRDAAGGRTYIFFEGAATMIDVWVNGRHLGQHRGAYTASIFDATDALDSTGNNLLAVKVSNHPNETADCLPCGLSKGIQLYHIYGGIYRKVWLVHAPACHIYPEMASPGVFIREDSVDADRAKLSIRTAIRNTSEDRNLTVRHRVVDADGKEVARFEGDTTVGRDEIVSSTVTGAVHDPRLWSPGSPYLYSVVTELVGRDGQVLDQVSNSIGLRSFRLDPERGFLLNGKPILLRGVCKHQETEDHLTAVSDDDLREDWHNLQDMGVNCIRLAHYPHARLEYDLADRAGILVWAENGNSNLSINPTTGSLITREMVLQNFNHPSIVFWCCGNESQGDEPATTYAAVIHEEDPSRLVTYASNGQHPQHLDFMAINIYPYWLKGGIYAGGDSSLSGNYISENGAGSSIATHCAYGKESMIFNVYEPEEYQELLAERIMPALFDPDSHVRLFFWWTMREFGDFKFKGRNSSGILTYANFRKDIFYLWQSYLRPDHPVVHICGKTHFLRTGDSIHGLKAYSNAKGLTLTINGKNRGEKANGEYRHPNGPTVNNVFFWNVDLHPGRNNVTVADDAGHSDHAVIYAEPNDVPASSDPSDIVQDLTSSNPNSPAYFVADEVHDQWPVYYQCDGHADNTFDKIPEELKGCQRIATRRLSDQANATELSFTISPQSAGADVYIVITGPSSLTYPSVRRDFAKWARDHIYVLQQRGFELTKIEGLWRDNDLHLIGCHVMSRHANPGERITIPAAARDYVVLVRAKSA